MPHPMKASEWKEFRGTGADGEGEEEDLLLEDEEEEGENDKEAATRRPSAARLSRRWQHTRRCRR